MTEIVGGIIEWIKTQEKVKSIAASTDKIIIALFKVLKKKILKLANQIHYLIEN